MTVGRARLLVSCPARPGIVAAVAQFLFSQGANIIHSDQHSTTDGSNRFYLRTEFDLDDLAARRPALEAAIATVAAPFAMEWYLALAAQEKRLAVFVSKEDHCLQELLWRRSAGEKAAAEALPLPLLLSPAPRWFLAWLPAPMLRCRGIRS